MADKADKKSVKVDKADKARPAKAPKPKDFKPPKEKTAKPDKPGRGEKLIAAIQGDEPTEEMVRPVRREFDDKKREEKARAAGHIEGQGRVKAVLSGDTIILVGQPSSPSEPPPEKTLILSGIDVPKMRAKGKKEELYAFEAREFVRKLLVGKNVEFNVVHAVDKDRVYGHINVDGQDVSKLLLAQGLAKAKPFKSASESVPVPADRLELEAVAEAAKSAKLGVWSEDKIAARTVEVIDKNARKFYDDFKKQKLHAVVEQVRDGSTVKIEIEVEEKGEKTFYQAVVHLAGIQAPRVPPPFSVIWDNYLRKKETNPEEKEPVEEAPAPFGVESKSFVEMRLLHRDVEIELIAVDKFSNLFATVLVPQGNIAVSLLKNGLAKIVDWSANSTTYRPLLDAAESQAKKSRYNLWRDWNLEDDEAAATKKDFVAKVIQIMSGDTIVVVDSAEFETKISLASIRAPKIGMRSLRSEPYALEAKEFLRNELIGRKVRVLVEYVKAEGRDGNDRVYGTVYLAKKNIGEALVAAGLAQVQSHRIEEDRSIHYEQLLAAESKAQKTKKGQHSKSPPPPSAVIDLSEKVRVPKEGDAELIADATRRQRDVTVKVRQYLPFLTKTPRVEGIVEHIFNGNRVKVFIPKENCLISLNLSAVRCPSAIPGKAPEPFAAEASNFTRNLVLQHDVDVEVETLDKAGNFIGHIFIHRSSVAVGLLQAGLAKIYGPSAEKSRYRDELYSAQDEAKRARLNIWKDWDEKKELEEQKEAEAAAAAAAAARSEATEDEPDTPTSAAAKSGFIPISICEITDPTTFFFHTLDKNDLETITKKVTEIGAAPAPAPEIVKNSLYAGLFSDGQWYRCKVLRKLSDGTGNVEVSFVDYGNTDFIKQTALKALDAETAKIPPAAKLGVLACVKSSKDYFDDALEALGAMVWEKKVLAKIEFTERGPNPKYHLSLLEEGEEIGIAEKLLYEGLLRVSSRLERRLVPLAKQLKSQEVLAKKRRAGIWHYGDVSSDEEEVPAF